MRLQKVTLEDLTDEQVEYFIDTWENNRSYDAILILREKLGVGFDRISDIAKQLREAGKIRDKKHQKFSDNDISTIIDCHKRGMTSKEIEEFTGIGVKGIHKCLTNVYGKKIPKFKPTLEGEIWKDIDGCETHQVSNMGRIYVKSINRATYGHKKHGYPHINIVDDSGNNHVYSVHKLVAKAFIPNPENKQQVDHIDSNPLNNRADNLRWVNPEEQYQNSESVKKKQIGQERAQKSWKLKPLIKKMLEIEPDKLELVKMIVNYKQ